MAATVSAGLLKLIDVLMGGKLTEYMKSRWLSWLRSVVFVRRREIRLVRRHLKEQLRGDGYQSQSLGSEEILELAESFSVSLGPPPENYSASPLAWRLGEEIQQGQRIFSIASGAGNGKTILGMLLPLLCNYFRRWDLVSLYVGPSDWVKGPPLQKVNEWLIGWPTAKRTLIILDSFNERVSNLAPLKELLEKVKSTTRPNCAFLVLYRPTTSQQGDISSAIVSVFGGKPLQLKLHFNPSDARQCLFYSHLLPGAPLTCGQVSHLLCSYAKLFPGYEPTRLSSVFILRHLYGNFRSLKTETQEPQPIRPPGDVLFDGLLPLPTELDNQDIKLLSRHIFALMKEGHRTTIEDFTSIREALIREKLAVKDGGDSFKLSYPDRSIKFIYDGSLTCEIAGSAIKISERVFAALHIADMITASARDRLSRDLQQFRGRSTYDACSAFVLPAYRRIGGRKAAFMTR